MLPVASMALSVSLLSACGLVIGADWDSTPRPDADGGGGDGGDAADGSVAPGEAGAVDADACASPPCDCVAVTAKALAAGEEHTCAIDDAGDVSCWGANALGQLGAGSAAPSSAKPMRVTGLSKVTAVASSYSHTCAVDGSGDVYCWGYNNHGQLGGGSATPSSVSTPVKVAGLSAKATAVATGWAHSCAVAGGGLYCWGYNLDGQLGIGSTSDELAPQPVSGLSTGVTHVAANIGHTCAIVAGAIKCWGRAGLVGDGTLTTRTAPVDVADLAPAATSIAAGTGFSCAVVSGSVTCWGFNDRGGLGDPGKTMSLRPNAVPGLPATATLVAASERACAIVAGGVRCWGDYPGDGTTSSAVATAVSGVPGADATALAVGNDHACAAASGEVWCWGAGSNGRLGSVAGAEVLRPVRACR